MFSFRRNPGLSTPQEVSRKSCSLLPNTGRCFHSLAPTAWTANGLRCQRQSWEHCINSASGVLSMLPLPCLPVLCCQSPVTCPHISSIVHITRLSAKQLMRLGSKLSIIFASLLCSRNILAHRNKETWTTMAYSQAFTLVHGYK